MVITMAKLRMAHASRLGQKSIMNANYIMNGLKIVLPKYDLHVEFSSPQGIVL